MPKFSIIVPIYKVERYIKQCMRSILDQTFKDFECICVDDCGNDNSMKIVKKMAEKDDRIIILHHEHNRGLSAARNTGLEIAKGEYTLFVDSDDWLETNCLEVVNKAFEKAQTESVFFDSYSYNDKEHKRSTEPRLNYVPGITEITPENIAKKSDFAWIKAYKTRAIKEKNLTFPEGLTFEDGEFFFKFFSFYPVTYVINNCLYNYREREGSIVTNAQKGIIRLEDMYQIVRNIRNFYIENNLYSKYKYAICDLLSIRMEVHSKVSKNYEKSIVLSQKILDEFGGVEEFEEFTKQKIPVVTAVLKLDSEIKPSLEKLSKQNYPNLEILCIDDRKNSDNTKIVENMAKSDSRIIISEAKSNNSYNDGIDASKGKYILFIKNGDFIEQDCINIAVKYFNETNQKLLIFNSNLSKITNVQDGTMPFDNNIMPESVFDPFCTIYDKHFLQKNNLRWNEMKTFADRDFAISAINLIESACYINKPYCTKNTIDNLDKSSVNEFKELIDKAYNNFKAKELLENRKDLFLAFLDIILDELAQNKSILKDLNKVIDNLDFVTKLS